MPSSLKGRDPSPPEPRLLQIHEYLGLLGATRIEVADEARVRALAAAETLWPALGLSAWSEHPRELASVQRSHATGAVLWHVTADHPDCFLILVSTDEAAPPYSYILFDIGAEYGPIYFVCPTLGIDEDVHGMGRDAVRDALLRLRGRKDPEAFLDKGGGTYLGAHATPTFYLEHQLVSPSSRYFVENVSDDAAVAAFLSYAFGRYEWTRDFEWQSIPL